ncbi:hypothetical protein [Tenuifilum thalassicum]|uniref:Uncharacterized protein n=1 Tax=Tenuifilum thalassicum TaxID=2590900 RepID=A0A7D4BYW6_9BACT|nr:hypothetical protein [Tenuifilum thalassicum]QKG79304.1 hypothetical protein FHG85_03175 [Tenuifilum thalassicum]
MNKILIALFVLTWALPGKTQLGYTLEEIIQKYGDNYSVGYNSDSLFYAIFENVKAGRSEKKTVMITLFNSDRKDAICIGKLIVYSLDEINEAVDKFNKKYVKKSELEWKDYENGILYIIDIDRNRGLFTITSLIDL